MGWIKDIISFFIEDTKRDIRFIRKVLRGEWDWNQNPEPPFDVKKFLKRYWIWILLIFWGIGIGYLIGNNLMAQKCAVKCSEALVQIVDYCKGCAGIQDQALNINLSAALENFSKR